MPTVTGTSIAVVVGAGTTLQPVQKPPGPVITVFDSFNRTVAAPNLGTADYQSLGYTWTTYSGTGSVNGTQAIFTTNSASTQATFEIDAPAAPFASLADFDLQFRFQSGSTINPGDDLVFRVSDRGFGTRSFNLADVGFNFGGGTLDIEYDSQNGAFSGANSVPFTWAISTWYIGALQWVSATQQLNAKVYLDGGTDPGWMVNLSLVGGSFTVSMPWLLIIAGSTITTQQYATDYIYLTNP